MSTKPKTQIIHRDPTGLRLHPQLKTMLGEWSNDDPRFLSLCDDIADRGIDEPLKVVAGTDLVADGRHRWRGAKRLQLKTVPTIEIPESEALTIMIQSLLQRRHFSPGQKAYIAAPLMDDAFAEAQARKLANLKNVSLEANSVRVESPKVTKTVEGWADEIGCSRRLLEQAREIHEAFKSTKAYPWNDIPDEVKELYPKRTKLTLREYFEPQIMSDHKPMGLGSVIKGFGYKDKNTLEDDTTRPQLKSGQLELFQESIETLFQRVKKLPALDEARPAIKALVSAISDDADLQRLEDLATEIEKQIAARKKQLAKES